MFERRWDNKLIGYAIKPFHITALTVMLLGIYRTGIGYAYELPPCEMWRRGGVCVTVGGCACQNNSQFSYASAGGYVHVCENCQVDAPDKCIIYCFGMLTSIQDSLCYGSNPGEATLAAWVFPEGACSCSGTDADGDRHYTPESCMQPHDDCNDNDKDVYPSAPELCDGKDNDCNGQVDEGLMKDCYTGPEGTLGVGLCKAGVQSCSNGQWGVCTGEVLPGAEIYDGKDNDCDGEADELDEICSPGPSLSGPDSISTGGTAQFVVSNPVSSVTWTVSGRDAHIDQSGTLYSGGSACGRIKVSARDSVCGAMTDLDVAVVNSGETLEDGVTLDAQGCIWDNFGQSMGQAGSNIATFTLPERYSRVILSYPTVFSPSGGVINVNGIEVYRAPALAPSWPICRNWFQTALEEFDITSIVHPGENTVYAGVPYLCNCLVAFADIRIETDNCHDNDCDGHYAISDACPQGDDCNDNDPVSQGCAIKMRYVSGNGQDGYVCKTLREPFVAEIASEGGAPMRQDVNIDWRIAGSPEGSNPRMTGDTAVMGDSLVLHRNYLVLGSMPGEYKAAASCAECTEGSPQDFTATAECPEVPVYRQYDSRWANDAYDTWCKVVNSTGERIGDSICKDDEYDIYGNLLKGYVPYSIANKGCALTSLAMVAQRYGSEAAPDTWNDFMTQSGGYVDGNVDWHALTNTDSQIRTVLYVKSEMPFSNSIMDTYLAKCMPVIVKVINPTGSWHWVVVTGKAGNEYSINDPGHSARTTLSAYNNEIYAIQVYEKNNGGCQ